MNKNGISNEKLSYLTDSYVFKKILLTEESQVFSLDPKSFLTGLIILPSVMKIKGAFI